MPESFTSCRQETWAGSSRKVARDAGDLSHVTGAVQTMDSQVVEGKSVLQSLMRRACLQNWATETEA